MDILQMGSELLKNQLGTGNTQSTELVSSVLQKLVGQGDQLDIAGLVAQLQGGGLGAIATSWLGDGENTSISGDQLKQVIGDADLRDAAAQLGTDENSLLGSLSQVLPQMVDKSSQGGSLLDSLGGMSGAMSMAKGLF